MKPDFTWEHVPGIGRLLKEGAKYRLPELTGALQEVAEEPCSGEGGAACTCTSCAARRTIATGGRATGVEPL